MSRLIPQFSCGAASAVACKLTIAEEAGKHEVVPINAFIKEEHPDNRRFLDDCEKWFGLSVTVLKNEKYRASTDQVWRRERYLKGRYGAPCSKHLKRKVLDAFKQPDDVMILGFTAEEQDRFDNFIDANNDLNVRVPLIEKGIGKADCLAMVERAGIKLPAMYRLGYHNANCIGCVKGGEGYWNKIRRDFPERFNAVADIQEAIGPGAYIFRDRKTGERYSLRDLPPNKGRFQDEPEISCSFFCEMAEQDIAASSLNKEQKS